jgi:transcriptional regulator with XRE-family HTH domain
MSTIKIKEQIAFLRRQKGVTQEELAQALGVTNQSVSKWESGVCCPDIQLLPEIAKYFGVSTDELLGYKPAEKLADICLKIKALFKETDEKDCFELAYKLAFLLAEGAFTKGYRSYVPWDTERTRSDEDI